MNQSQIKDILQNVEPAAEDFFVLFTGKESSKVDGLYKPDSREILLHNRNFNTDNQLVYTALHEYAHHLHFCSPIPPKSSRAHTRDFWAIFHRLLEKAEVKGHYRNAYLEDPELKELTQKIRDDYMTKNGKLMKELGELLLQAHSLCQKKHLAFEDYLDRILSIKKTSAKSMMKVFHEDVRPEIGFENMKMIAGIKEPENREKASFALLSGKSPDQVKQEYTPAKESPHDIDALIREKNRVQKSIDKLKMKLTALEVEIMEKEMEA